MSHLRLEELMLKQDPQGVLWDLTLRPRNEPQATGAMGALYVTETKWDQGAVGL
jgi:hypothetical protein